MQINAKARLLAAPKTKGDQRLDPLRFPRNQDVPYKGHVLRIEKDPKATVFYIGLIDGKPVSRGSTTLGDITKLIMQLYNTVDGESEPDATPEGLNIKAMLIRIRNFFSGSRANGWDYEGYSTGDMMGKNKTKAFTVEFDKTVRAAREDVGSKQMPNTHRFLIQATFSSIPEAKDAGVMIWLAQGGQIITVGLPQFKFKQGDFASFENAIKQAMAVPDKQLIQTLYKSGYENYGRH